MRYLILLLFLTSCSQSWFCRKCLDGAKTKVDTIRVDSLIYIPLVEFDTVVIAPINTTDTLIVEGPERVRIKFRDLPGPTVYLSAECLPDTVRVTVEVPCVTEATIGWGFWKIAGLSLLVLVVGLVIGRVLK